MGKAVRIWRGVKRYVTHDLREIIIPSSLPNPPGYVPPPKRPPLSWIKATGQALRAYTETWNAEKLRERMREKHGADPLDDAEAEATKAELRDLAQEFGEAARGGATALRPFLQNLWNTRAVAYRDAVQQFIAGYKEGFQEANRPDIPPEVAQEMAEQQRAEGPPEQQQPAQQEQPADGAAPASADGGALHTGAQPGGGGGQARPDGAGPAAQQAAPQTQPATQEPAAPSNNQLPDQPQQQRPS